MFGKSLIAAGAVIGLLSASTAFAEPSAKPLSASTVTKIQDLSRARAQFNYHKKSHGVDSTAAILGGAALLGGGFTIGRTTANNTVI